MKHIFYSPNSHYIVVDTDEDFIIEKNATIEIYLHNEFCYVWWKIKGIWELLPYIRVDKLRSFVELFNSNLLSMDAIVAIKENIDIDLLNDYGKMNFSYPDTDIPIAARKASAINNL